MSRSLALSALRALAAGLPADLSGETRMLERVAGHDDAEALRSMLVEIGVRHLLDTPDGRADTAGDRA